MGAPTLPSVPWLGGVAIVKVNAALSISLALNVTMSGVFSLVLTDCACATGKSLTATTSMFTIATLL